MPLTKIIFCQLFFYIQSDNLILAPLCYHFDFIVSVHICPLPRLMMMNWPECKLCITPYLKSTWLKRDRNIVFFQFLPSSKLLKYLIKLKSTIKKPHERLARDYQAPWEQQRMDSVLTKPLTMEATVGLDVNCHRWAWKQGVLTPNQWLFQVF